MYYHCFQTISGILISVEWYGPGNFADQVLGNERRDIEGKDNFSVYYWISEGEFQILIQYLLSTYSAPETMPGDAIYQYLLI